MIRLKKKKNYFGMLGGRVYNISNTFEYINMLSFLGFLSKRLPPWKRRRAPSRWLQAEIARQQLTDSEVKVINDLLQACWFCSYFDIPRKGLGFIYFVFYMLK